jgi:hypothetical protein
VCFASVAPRTGDRLCQGVRLADLTELAPRVVERADRFNLPRNKLATLREVEEEYVEWMLQQCGGNKTRAADHLGIDPAAPTTSEALINPTRSGPPSLDARTSSTRNSGRAALQRIRTSSSVTVWIALDDFIDGLHGLSVEHPQGSLIVGKRTSRAKLTILEKAAQILAVSLVQRLDLLFVLAVLDDRGGFHVVPIRMFPTMATDQSY